MNLFEQSTVLNKMRHIRHSALLIAAVTIPVSAYSQEMCRYPVVKVSHEFTIVDFTGIQNPDFKSLLAGKSPTIICETAAGASPVCSTPWGGKVTIKQNSEVGVRVQSIQDREGQLIDFRNDYGISRIGFADFVNETKFAVHACGRLERMGMRTGEWYVLKPELLGRGFGNYRYKTAGVTRSYFAKRQSKIIFGPPISATEGTRGAF